jgi:hypothetical protein
MLGPESCRHVVICHECHHPATVSDSSKESRCGHCDSRKLERLEFDDDSEEDGEEPITGLTCPRCGKPTLTLEPGGSWD